ncbi:GTPase [uncultured Thiothrix sp.]|uniref:YcjF family protein n=1 Tax=uncultured Thiothrix sp. TaxID=223185 RepID=UPI00262D7F7A|nr:GTPase [uncultured Thiothrix sp.]
MNWSERVTAWANPSKNPELEPVFAQQAQSLPILWLLGKTGAGKSSLIQALTGDSKIDIGNGFQPCTKTANVYDYPQDKPLLRFLDTRGLSEADYDAREDIAACEDRSHALLIVLKADDPEQSDVVKALKQIRASGKIKNYLVVHTGILQVSDLIQRQQAIAHNQAQVEKVLAQTLDQVAVDFIADDPAQSGVSELKQALADLLPILAQFNDEQLHTNQEEKNFIHLKKEVLWYAGAAAASDVLPAVGLVAVPSIQGKMLHSLANQYGVEWDKKLLSEFATALGASFGIKYATRLGLRQLAKLIPVYGQTIGTATAASISFATTYALGRAASKYLYHQTQGEAVDQIELQTLYEDAMRALLPKLKNDKDNQDAPNSNQPK